MKSQQTIKETRAITLVTDEAQLRLSCEDVKNDENIEDLAEDLIHGMELFHGAGLAAPQIGIQKKACVIDYSPLPPLILINPEIIKSKGEQKSIEGCLSFPGMQLEVTRAREVTIKYQNRYHKWCRVTLQNMRAIKAQHEIDHLNSKLIIDYIQKGQEVNIKI